MTARDTIAVIGGGISGLTTALTLAIAGHRVTVYAAKALPGRIDRDYDPTFASLHPAAFIDPQLCDFDARWWAESRQVFQALATVPDAGMSASDHWELFEEAEEYERSLVAPHFERVDPLTPDDIGFASPDGSPLRGWHASALIADLPHYIAFLAARLHALGIEMHTQQFTSLAQALDTLEAGTLINCTGLGAHALVPDPAVTPIAGQLLRLKYDAALPRERIGNRSWHYFPRTERYPSALYGYPRADRLILGGSRLRLGWHGEAPADPAEAPYDTLVALNTYLLRAMFGCELAQTTYAYTVGMRPYREGGPRLAEETIGGRRVLHNYGHGGAGVSLSWGCALALARLLDLDLGPEALAGHLRGTPTVASGV